MKTKLDQHKDYIKFLERRLASSNYKKNVSPEEYEKTEAKLKKSQVSIESFGKMIMALWISEAGTSNELRTRHPLSVRIGSVPPI